MVFGFAVAIAAAQEEWLVVFLPLGFVAMAAGAAGIAGAALFSKRPRLSAFVCGIAGAVLILIVSSYVFYSRHWQGAIWGMSGVLLIVSSVFQLVRGRA